MNLHEEERETIPCSEQSEMYIIYIIFCFSAETEYTEKVLCAKSIIENFICEFLWDTRGKIQNIFMDYI